MDIRPISADLSVSSQIEATDIAELKKKGFRSIICNRPDSESADQPSFEEIAAAATKAGLEARYLPVQPGLVSDEDAAAFDEALRQLPGPVFAYCRTGTRSATLWALAEERRDHRLRNMMVTVPAP